MKQMVDMVGVSLILLALSAAACGGKDKPPLTPDSEFDAGGGSDPSSSPTGPSAPK